MLNKLYEHCKSDVAATNNKEFRRTLQYTVKCDICDMCCKILHSPFLIHRRVPSESDILRYIQACRASAIYGIAIYWRYTHKRVPALVTRVTCMLARMMRMSLDVDKEYGDDVDKDDTDEADKAGSK